jgi:hypothetical protein
VYAPPDGSRAAVMIRSAISGEKCDSTISMNSVNTTPFMDLFRVGIFDPVTASQ